MLKLTDISLWRGENCLLQDLNFSVADGQVVQIMGRNGSGKTSLLRAIAGLLPLADGQVELNDKKLAISDMIYLGHTIALHPALTVIENLRFLIRLKGEHLLVSEASMDKALAFMQLSAYANVNCDQLSAGQKQRVNLVRLLLTSCKLWLLDEPFANLDQSGVDLLQEVIYEHLIRKGMVVMATHSKLVLPAMEIAEIVFI